MNSNNNSENIKLYQKLVNEHGGSFKSLNWGSKESQELRFKVLCESADINNKSIIDVGCGLCDMYNYIIENNYTGVSYTGIDITKEMVAASQKRFPSVEIFQAEVGDIKKPYDCIFASGIFTYQSKFFLEEFVTSAFNKTNHVLAFNALSSWSGTQDQGEFYANPMETVAFCKTLSPWITFRHDYHSGDFTIYMYKNRNI